jgi:SAM-dependent methyltransferase
MTSRHETGIDLENKPTPPPEQPVPASSEAAYDRLTCYGFVRRYVEGKTVADIGWEGVGHGSRLLAETAESVTGLTDSPEAVDLASAVYSAPNVRYRGADLPELPLSDGSFDVVAAFGVVENLERPEDLVREAKRVLKEDGVLVISALDKQADANDRGELDGRREMYVPEFRELLERHFGHVHLYRQGAVAGGLVFPATAEEVSGAPVEAARFSLTDHRFGVEPPTTRSVIAVCSDAAEALRAEERPYLLLDRDRRVFDEYEERVEDVELLRGEIQRMQETEVQAFVDAIKVRKSLIQELPRYASHILPHMRNIILEHLIHRRNIIRGNIYVIRRKGAKGLARGAFRRSFAFYRRLQARTRDTD